jgi:hypothetical protein
MMPAVHVPRPTVEERIRAATWFAAHGFGVFSVWSTDADGTCRCPKGRACDNAGKHPIGRQGFLGHTSDPGRIRILLSAGSEPNYGLVCPDGVFVLDVDGDGVARLVELEATLGPLPPTLRTNTAHGQHVFLRWPADHPRPIGQLFGYVTRWGSGAGAGYVIGPRSVHATGAVYAPASADVEIATLPEAWVRAAIAKQPVDGAITVTGARPASAIAVGQRHAYLRDRARHLRGVGLSGEALFAAVMDLNHQLPEPKSAEDVRRAIGDVEARFGPDPIDPATGRTAALPAPELEDAPLTEFASEPVRWLWDAWLPRGVVTLMDGNPGVSKSTLVADLVARITTGRCWPDGSAGDGRAGRAMWITTEDDPGRVLRPRIEAAGGDASLVRFVKGEVVFPSGAGPFTDLVVRRAAEPLGLALVILDPLFSHIDATVRTIADAEMRKGVMNPLTAAAEAAGVAILVVRHFSKDTTASAINRGAGSLGGIVGAARALWTVVPDPHDESGEAKVVGVSKLNYARVHKALRYRVVDRMPPGWVAGSVSGIEWLGEASSSIEAMLGAGPRSLEATHALEEILAEGRVDARAGEARMRARGFGASAIKGARAALGVKPHKSGMTGGWTWELPAPEEADATDALEGAEDDGPTSSTSSASRAGARGREEPASSTSSDSSKEPETPKKSKASALPAGAPAREDGPALRVVPPASDVHVPCFFYREHQFKHARIPGTDRFGCPICHSEEGPIA